jgi:peptidoglycan/LPS O-acetylase OafA/YrhL
VTTKEVGAGRRPEADGTPPAGTREAGTGFRPDIEGMRAIAIVSVLLCHAGVPFLAGGFVGVDVFFVISGFLITRLLLKELHRSETISLRNFYARRAKRLLPQAALLLATVGIVSFILFSPVRAVSVSGDIISSAVYVANWHFAAQSVDYFAQGLEPSPVLHLWSLSIEEQFYVVWPTLMLLVTFYWRRQGKSGRPALWTALAVILVGSLLLGIQLTDTEPASAYFNTFGRAWELGLGAALALLGAVRIPRSIAAAIGWAGVAAILYACFAYSAATPFPGVAALIPTLGAAALILAGSSIYAQTRGAPAMVLGTAPSRYIGRISYAWYMWHWPFLIFAAAIWGPLSVAVGLAVVAVSVIPTMVSHHLIEDPVRRSRLLARMPNRALLIGAGCMAVGIGTGIALTDLQPTIKTAHQVAGAAALRREPTPQQSADAVRPNPLEAQNDRSREFTDGCLVGTEGTTSNTCTYGDLESEHTIVLFGDSHAMQYFPALEVLAERHHWRLVALTKRECPPGEVKVRSQIDAREYSQCDAWRENSLRRIEGEDKGTMVVMSGDAEYTPYDDGGGQLKGAAAADALESGYIATLERLDGAGFKPVVIRDNPASEHDVPSCVSENLDDLEACAFPWVRDKNKEFDVRAARATGTHLIDVTPEVCPSDLCRAVIGDALVFRDKAHLTATYARTLSPWIEKGLRAAGLE